MKLENGCVGVELDLSTLTKFYPRFYPIEI